MKDLSLGRREFIRIGLLTGFVTLYGCSLSSKSPTITVPRGLLAKELLQTLPSPWTYKLLQAKSHSQLAIYEAHLRAKSDLIAIGDGWLGECPFEQFQVIGDEDNLRSSLSGQALTFLKGFPFHISNCLWPIVMTPWVMIYRKNDEWMPKSINSWEILLHPSLKRNVVFPNSPRLIIELADRIKGFDVLKRLRLQAKSFDDRNGLNWVVSGKARVAVLPLQNCVKVLKSDSRFTIGFPMEGSPLNWTLLLRPKSSIEPFPSLWIKKTWSRSLIPKLLSRGVMPPIPFSELVTATKLLPNEYQGIYQMEQAFENCWSLLPLSFEEEKALEVRWLNSSP